MKNNKIVILFSGGTDSTLAAALATNSFDEIHLITYSRLGIASVENSKVNALSLQEKYNNKKIIHKIIKIDKLFNHVSYENYFKNIIKHGFMNLSTCGLCKLSMHIRTIKYCMDNEIYHVSDGANAGMSMFPAQMKSVIKELEKMYMDFNIHYSNPVYDYDAPEEAKFIKNTHVLSTAPKEEPVLEKRQNVEKKTTKTAGQVLYNMGLAPAPNVKGSEYDRKRQPRCFQFIIFNIFAIKYFLEKYSYKEYEERTTEYFKSKIKTCSDLLKSKKDKVFEE